MITHATSFIPYVAHARLTLKIQSLDRHRGHAPHGLVECPEMVGRLMDRFMVRGTNGPMQRMVHLRSRCMQFNKQRTSEGRIQWDGDRVFYKDVGFDMGQLRGMVGDFIQQARQILTEELLLGGRRERR
jgi:hypothetical protein